MLKKLLFTLLTLTLAFGRAGADTVTINVDKAANVKVTVNNGATELALTDGENVFTAYGPADSPMIISARKGAMIDKVVKNSADQLVANYVGDYTLGIETMTLDIETSGDASGDLPVDVGVWFQLNGPAGSVSITCDGASVPVSSQTFDYSRIKPDVPCLIAPTDGYYITKVEGDRGTVVDNSDGTWSYTTSEDMTFVNIFTEAKPVEGTSFSVVTPYLPNIAVVCGRTTAEGEEYADVTVAEDGSAILPEGYEFINFWATDGGEILSVMRNGTSVNRSDFTGWRSMVAEGDVFEVNVRGPEVEVMFYSNNYRDGVGMEAFNILVNGKPLEGLEGEMPKALLHRGDNMSVSGKGLNTCTWVMCGMAFMEQSPFDFNIGPNNMVTVAGTTVSGVRIDVNNAACIVARQLNGYGDALTLTDGENNFDLDEIKNNLSITAAEDCQILSVMVNQMTLQASSTGSYDIKVENGMLIQVNARPVPTSVPVTVMVCDTDNGNAVSDHLASHVTLTVDGERQELSGVTTLDVKYLARVEVSGEFGYVISAVDAGRNFLQEADGVWWFIAEEPCTLTIDMREIVAPEGYVLVEFRTNNADKVSFLPYNADKERIEGSYPPSQPGVVKVGDYVGVKKFSYDLLFKSITLNGEPVEIGAPDEQEPFQEYLVKIEEESILEAILYDPNEGHAEIICWNTDIAPFGLNAAQLYVNDNGTLTQNYQALPGEVVELVVPYVAPGYRLTHILGQSATSPDITDLEHLTFTVPETIINPETGDPYLFIFKPAVEIDQANPPVVLEFYPSYIESEVEEGKEVVGYLVGIEPFFNREVTAMFATDGMEVNINAYSRDDYRCVRLFDQNDNTVTTPYKVNTADAYLFQGFNKINFGGEFVPIEEGVEESVADSGLRYDALRALVEGSGEITVSDLGGVCVASGRGSVEVASLPSGLYVARCEGRTLKFVK